MSVLMRKMLGRVLMDEATDGTEGGTGAGGVEAEASILESLGKGEDPAVVAAAPVVDAEAPPPTVEQAALKASETDARRPAHVPAKFWDAAKGEINHEAWAKSYTGLEQRMKDTGLPPKEADEYKFEPPAGLEDIELDQEMSSEFRKEAHELGLTQKQYQSLMARHVSMIPQIADQIARVGASRLQKDLDAHYKTPQARQVAIDRALTAVMKVGDDEEIALARSALGNTQPWVYRVLAKYGATYEEDKGIGGDIVGGSVIDDEYNTLMQDKTSAYWNPKDPKHDQAKALVSRYHKAQEAANKRKAA